MCLEHLEHLFLHISAKISGLFFLKPPFFATIRSLIREFRDSPGTHQNRTYLRVSSPYCVTH